MNKHDCYVVDGCVDFIPVKRSTLTSNGVEVTIVGSAQKQRVLVDKVCQMPKFFEPQKVVVPKFVAEWIEHCKGRRGSLYFAFTPSRMSKELNEWMALDENDDVFARAWLDGYEVEQERLYTVQIPNPNRTSFPYTLYRKDDGKIIIIGAGDDYEKREEYKLTEAEIKQDFEWAWQFAKEVE